MDKEIINVDRRRMLIGLSALTACCALPVFNSLPVFAQSADKLRAAVGSVPDYTHFYVADALNLWSQHGLAGTQSMFPAGRIALDAMFSGNADIASSAETPAIFAAVNGLPIQIIATVARYQSFNLIAGPKIKDLNDLAGKRIAYMHGTNTHFYLVSLIKSRNLAWSDIVPINMASATMVPSLVNGDVDGFVWSEPLISEALKQGPQFHRLHAEGVYSVNCCVSALRATVEKQPDMLAKALRALMDVDKIMKTEESKAQKIMSDVLKLDPAAAAALWPGITFEVAMDKQRLIPVLEQQAQWAIENKLTKDGAALPDFAAIVTDEIYRKAKTN